MNQVAKNVFGLTSAVLECSESTTLDDFGSGILVDEGAGDYFSFIGEKVRGDVSCRGYHGG